MACNCKCGHQGTCICCAAAAKDFLTPPSAEDKSAELLKKLLAPKKES